MDHTISVEDFKDYTHELEMASCGGRVLAALIDFNSGKIVYKVGRRGEDAAKLRPTLESAIKAYNELP